MPEEKKKHLDEDAVLLLNKGKRGLGRLIFGRTAIIILLLAAQFLLLFFGFWQLSGSLVYGVSLLIGLAVTLTIVNKPANPAIKITWIILIMLAPIFAVPFYLFVSMDWGHRLTRAMLDEISQKTARYVHKDLEGIRALREQSPQMGSLADYMERSRQQLYYKDSRVKYLPSGEAFFAEVLERLKQAKRFIFLEYFIVEEGYMWGRILSILQRKVKEGVDVRLLYDGTCAIGKLPYQYPQQLKALGIRCKMYAPLRPFISTHYNNRDHRKILVVDGRTAFTGGINLADEYINRRILHGHWKDTAVMITGAAVRSFTLMFLQMWSLTEYRDKDFSPYLDASRPVSGDGWVLPYCSSPFQQEKVGEMAYMDILNQAVRYVHITTPYLIIDHELTTALTFAAKRGVDVKLILPGQPDKRTVFALTRSYYPELLAGGVEIYEYTPGFIHAKMFVSDDSTAVVGSINLDYRSLYLHFECAALLYRCAAVADVERDFQRTLSKCRPITLEDCRRDALPRRVAGWLLRPLAPLM
ncbi:MAG: cardiolipin synthase [Oscillospiraceae bacterium]|jgi:cardiolipin synthase|nr:cardiolipin synthase [Oscillospiraceae bacterium]